MAFSSLAFFAFFLVVFVGSWRISPQRRSLFLLLASMYFYFSWKPVYGLVLLLTILLTFFSAQALEKNPSRKYPILISTLSLIFATLFFFKYFNFFSVTTTQFLSSLGVPLTLPHFEFLLPLGISFFTFQTAGYLIDVFRGKHKAEKNLLPYALFVSFFPLVSSGPIERAGHLLPQLKKPLPYEYARVVSGAQLFLLGLFKKIVIADNLGLVVTRVFSDLPNYKGLSLVLAVFLFSWQIYYDFSGYTDSARGVARMLGYDLFENFRTPYFASSVGEFWRRWHISLSSWFKDYLYIPLGGNRKGLLRTCLNTFIVFTLCGLWHGASWNFVLWGALHGLYLSSQRIFTSMFKSVTVPSVFSHLLTYALVCLSWIFFRAATLSDTLYILRNMVEGIKNFVLPSYVWSTLSQMFVTNVVEMAIIAFCLFCILFIETLSLHKDPRQLFQRLPAVVRCITYGVVISLMLLLRNAEITQFIYVQF